MNNISIEEAIEKYGFYSCRPIGTSMFPTLNTSRDTVLLRKKEGRLKKYDVALYRRPDGMLVLHRVMSVESNSYTMCGDNQYKLERGVREEAVIAVLDGIYKGERFISCQKKSYRAYVKLWCASLFFRRIVLRILRCFRRSK